MPKPRDLVGSFVVEVGERQAWPFLQFCDNSQAASREVRLYIDTAFVVTHSAGEEGDDVTGLLALNNLAVVEAVTDVGGLRITFTNGGTLFVAAAPQPETVGDVWWLTPWLSNDA